MRKKLRGYVIPHHDNGHIPHVLQETGIVAMFLIVAFLFTLSNIHSMIVPGGDGLMASVVSSVLVDQTNAERLDYGAGSLRVNPILQKAAQMKADSMAKNGYFAHTSPSGQSPWYWFAEAGYDFSYAGENLAVRFYDSRDVTNAWMNSPGHRANILNPHFTEIGIATAKGMYKGYETTFVVELFGSPAQPVLASTNPLGASVGSVALASASHNASPENNTVRVSVIDENDMYIAVRREVVSSGAELAGTTSTTSAAAGAQAMSTERKTGRTERTASGQYSAPAPTYATPFERLLTEPARIYQIFYNALAILVLLALGFLMIEELERRHVENVLYAACFLVLLATVTYITHAYIFASSVNVL